VSHVNAALTPRHRLTVARLVVDEAWPISEVAARFQVSWPTVKRWVDRYLAGESMQDRSSRPRSSPNKIVDLRQGAGRRPGRGDRATQVAIERPAGKLTAIGDIHGGFPVRL
jgi:transposase-like protein